MSSTTLVTGLWNINRDSLNEGWSRSYQHYLDKFSQLLAIDNNLIVFGDSELREFVFKHRRTENTQFIERSLDWFKNNEFFEPIQKIRNNPLWYNQAGWLTDSTQAKLEMYNPLVMSKMFLLHDAKILDSFNSSHLFWIDAGITNTIHPGYLTHDKVIEKLPKYISKFSFICFPYEANNEIHGFEFKKINEYAGSKVDKVARGGFFGGPKDSISDINSIYYNLLKQTLSEGYMGTEESIFSIMCHVNSDIINYFQIESNGLLGKFFEDLKNDNIKIKSHSSKKQVDLNKLKVSIYMLTFNFPQQVEHTIQTWLKHSKWITNTRNILIDNSTNEESRLINAELCKKYNFEHIINHKNLGINGGRFQAAQHFQESDSDYYIFLEDDMGLHPPKNNFCRNGFRMYVPDLYDKVLKIIAGDVNVDFLKFSYTEVYMDNNIQVSWYNVPRSIRNEVWPHYAKLPMSGLDPNCPRTKFETIEVVDGLSYIKGEIYYANWPMIVGKKGNKKMFLDTTWAHPYEQTWMSHMFQETRKGNLKPAVLLASPINHNRIMYYKSKERKENVG
jgi:hypothetical protein